MALLDNTFGIEIEFYLPEGGTTIALARAISHRGLSCVAEVYNHTTRSHWKIVPDRSLDDFARGFELVSPVLTGQAGLDAITIATEVLMDFGCTVSKKCGLHVHVGASGATTAFFKNLLKLYGHFEPVIDRFLPLSRRASNSQWCRSVTNLTFTAVDRALDLDALLALMTPYPRADPRYSKINLAAYRRHRTVEFRQHSGTLEASKTINWTLFCLRMVEAAKRGDGLPVTHSARNAAPPRSKAYLVGQMMLRPEGVSGPEAMAATGWPSISLPQQASICGLTFTTQRTGRAVRYFAQAAAASTNVAPSLDRLMDVLGCTDAERAYFRTRTVNLSGPVELAA